MKLLNKIYADFEKLGFTQEETLVYLTCLELGATSVQGISQKANLKRTSTHTYVKKLLEKGLLRESKLKTKRTLFPEKPMKLQHLVEDMEWEVQNIRQNLPNTIQNVYNYLPNQDPSTLHYDEEKLEKEFLECLKTRKMEEKFKYIGKEQAKTWLELCNSREYQYYRKSFNLIQTIKKDIANQLSGDVNLIALGVGDGLKELEIIKESMHQRKIGFFPVDLSRELAQVALQNCTDLTIEKEVFLTNIVENLRTMSEHIRKRYYPNHLFTLLGNTLGNYPQGSILGVIRQSMHPQDLFLVGVSLNQGEDVVAEYKYDAFPFVPLRRTSIEQSDGDIEAEFGKDKLFPNINTIYNYFKFTKNVTISYGDEEILFRKGERILIGYSHKYSKESLIDILTGHGFKIIKTYTDTTGKYIKLLCKIQSRSNSSFPTTQT